MPAQEVAFLTDDAVLWPFVGNDRYGEPTVGAPVQIKCRWEDARREVLVKDGSSVAIDATVMTSREIKEGSNMWLGQLADWYGSGSGTGNQDDQLMYVKMSDRTEDLKGRCIQSTVYLMRYRQALPGQNS